MDKNKEYDLDVLEPSNSLFVSNYKELKKQQRELNKQLKEANEKLKEPTLNEDEEFYIRTNKEYILMSLSYISSSLDICNDIFTNGVTPKKMKNFYDSLYNLYEKGETF